MNRPLALSLFAMFAIGCTSDQPLSPRVSSALKPPPLASSNVLAMAENGTLGRGEQDLLVRFERQLPGFGGLYLADGAVRVYMKDNVTPLGKVRAVLAQTYAAHRNPYVRQLMRNASSATIIHGHYALSELISLQKKIEAEVDGWSSVGTRIMENKVVIGFPDTAALLSGVATIGSLGIASDAFEAIIMPIGTTTSTFVDYIRPVRAGLAMQLQNDSYWRHTLVNKNGVWIPWYYGAACSVGFNVHTAYGDYFMTAGHCATEFRGVNGIVGDSVFQSARGETNTIPPLVGFIGVIWMNPAYDQGNACPVYTPDRINWVHYDYCTTADVALGAYVNGITGDRRVATSVTGGINGNPGSVTINNFYPITATLNPEYVDSVLHHGVAKSGGTTFTTSGTIRQDMVDFRMTMCMPMSQYGGCVNSVQFLLMNATTVNADVYGGDSGAAVFTGYPNNGSPYAAMGILSGRSGPANISASQQCTTCFFAFSRWDRIEPKLNIGLLEPRTTF
jgi:hypothetical protein